MAKYNEIINSREYFVNQWYTNRNQYDNRKYVE